MNKRACLLFAGSLATIVFLLSVDQGRAEPQLTTQSPAPTAPFRDPDNRLARHKATNAQRQEAAKRTAERRALAGISAGNSLSAPKTSAPQTTEGGTK